MKNICKTLLLVSLLGTMGCQKQKSKVEYKPTWESLKQHQTPEWFKDAKFGIYFHWGVYSYPGMGAWYPHYMYGDESDKKNSVRKHHVDVYGEDYQYHQFIPKFTAKYFQADDWAKLFKASGAKFAGPVCEHCDNFSNWDSKVNKYNSVNMGPHIDIVGELAKAIRKQDMKFIATFHHSWEWGWYRKYTGQIDTTAQGFEDFYGETVPKGAFENFSNLQKVNKDSVGYIDDKTKPSAKFVSTWKTKIYEVIDKYKPDLLYFDSRLFLLPEKDRKEMAAYYYNQSQKANKDVVLTYKNLDMAKGSATLDLEQGRMDEKTDFTWATDDTWTMWAWAWKHKMELKSTNNITDELIDIVSKNGCLILDITPTSDGKIPEEMRKGLLEIGEWLKVNGEAIYKTRPFITYGEGPTKLEKNHFGGVQSKRVKYTSKDFRFTQNGKDLYIIQMEIPTSEEKCIITSFSKNGEAKDIKIKSLQLLGSDEKIEWKQDENGISFTAPKVAPDNKALVYKAQIIE